MGGVAAKLVAAGDSPQPDPFKTSEIFGMDIDQDAEMNIRARLVALEHAMVMMMSQECFVRAAMHEQPAELYARQLADGLVSTFVEGPHPGDYKTMIVGCLRSLGDQLVVNGQTFDELNPR